MENPDTELIFPPRSISSLCKERDAVWQELVSAVECAAPDSPDQLAFILMMARLSNCATCNADSYRAIHGCTLCARQSLKRFRGSDKDLTRMFKMARVEVGVFLQKEI